MVSLLETGWIEEYRESGTGEEGDVKSVTSARLLPVHVISIWKQFWEQNPNPIHYSNLTHPCLANFPEPKQSDPPKLAYSHPLLTLHFPYPLY